MASIVKMESPDEIREMLNINPKGKLHSFFTATCALHMDKYVPFDEGILAGTVVENGHVTNNVTVDEIIYDQEYAEYQYYGERRDGSHKIVNRTLDYHPLATSYWDMHMETAEMDDVVKEVQKEFERLGGKI